MRAEDRVRSNNPAWKQKRLGEADGERLGKTAPRGPKSEK